MVHRWVCTACVGIECHNFRNIILAYHRYIGICIYGVQYVLIWKLFLFFLHNIMHKKMLLVIYIYYIAIEFYCFIEMVSFGTIKVIFRP